MRVETRTPKKDIDAGAAENFACSRGTLGQVSGTLTKQRGKKSAESLEESTRRRVVRRCGFSASGSRTFIRGRRKRSGQRRRCSWTRFQRQRPHILNRRGRRAGRMEHERRFYLHVKIIRRDRGV